MRIAVTPSSVSGTLAANPSKSHAQRAIAIAALTHGKTFLRGIGSSEDVQSALRVADAMGAQIGILAEGVIVTGGLPLLLNTWYCGESGLCLRMFSAIAAHYDTKITLSAHGTLTARPVEFMKDTFDQLEVSFSSNHGLPPIHITGPIRNHNLMMDGSVSSQLLTGLLIALPLEQRDSTIEVKNLRSKPYIDLTLATIWEFGGVVSHDNYEVFHIPGRQKYQPGDLTIQGDWSGMANILVSAALVGEVRVSGLPSSESQADGKILEALQLSGVNPEIHSGEVLVSHNDLHAFEFDCTHCPDLFPPLVALAAHCKGISKISGVHRLKSKESDRGLVLVNEFSKLGVRIWHAEDALFVEGGNVSGGEVESHGDHRIAMALASVALKATGPVLISNADCVVKSYPDFFKDLESLGATISNQSDANA